MSASPDDLSRFGVRLGDSVERGRHLIASEDIPTGHLVLSNMPFSRVLHPSLWDSRCYRCFSKIPQAGGVLAVPNLPERCLWFCDEKCRENYMLEDPDMGIQELCIASQLRHQIAEDALLADVILAAKTLRKMRVFKDSDVRSSALLNSSPILSTPADVNLMAHHDATDMKSILQIGEFVIRVGLLGSAAQDTKPADVATLLLTFICNNFAVTNNLLVRIGAAVCPAGAILNHSCSPNCCVTWNQATGAQEIRTIRAVSRGQELVHSYIDVALPTQKRKAKLSATYGFICKCCRCARAPTIRLSKSLLDEAKAACDLLVATVAKQNKGGKRKKKKKKKNGSDKERSSRDFVETYMQSVCSQEEDGRSLWNLDFCMETDLIGGLEAASRAQLTSHAELPDASAKTFRGVGVDARSLAQISKLRDRELTSARQRLAEAATNGNIEVLQHVASVFAKWLHPLHLDRFQVTNELLTASLESGKFQDAIIHVTRAVEVMDHYYGSEYLHPMIGLQLYTLGNLLVNTDNHAEAIPYLYRSLKYLVAAHGRDSDLVKGLEVFLLEAKSHVQTLPQNSSK